jgi:rhodanese-related sulfurtransferase
MTTVQVDSRRRRRNGQLRGANFAGANFAAATRQPEDIVEYDARTIWAFALVAAAALAYKYLPRWRSRSPYVEPAELKHRLDAGDDVVVVDVRTVGEYAGKGGHLPGAVNLPLGNLKARLEARDGDLAPLKDHPVYVHCTLDLRAARAARALRDAGFTDVSVLNGGYRAWRRKGFPLEGKR